MIQFRCPGCQKLLQIASENAGKLVACPCGQQSRAPNGQAVNAGTLSAAPQDTGILNAGDSPLASAPATQGDLPGSIQNPYASIPDNATGAHAGAAQGSEHLQGFGSEPGNGAEQNFEQPYLPQQKTSPLNSTTFAGIAMMVGAAVWFFVGLAAGRIFFYPPILFVFGIISFFKGLMGGGN